jgi:sugar phosphate isomerase/epimerase
MHLSFTTLACPDWDLDTVIRRAREYGYDAIDFRFLRDSVDIHELPEFTTTLGDTAQAIRDAGLAVSGISSSIRIAQADAGARRRDLDEVLPVLAEAARALDCPFIRVFGGALDGRQRSAIVDDVAAHFSALASRADGVTLVLETHDDWSLSDQVASVMERVSASNTGVLWDIHHPWRMGEEMETTWERIGQWVRYIHVKDARIRAAQPGGLCLVGEGVVPVGEAVSILQRGGYDGYLVLEWEKKWHPEIEEPDVALPAYVRTMTAMLAR